MSKSKEVKQIEFISDDDVKNIFTDIIQLNVNNETVNIKLAIKDVDKPAANISHNVIMTLPHFLRFAEVCKKSAEQIISQFENQKD